MGNNKPTKEYKGTEKNIKENSGNDYKNWENG